MTSLAWLTRLLEKNVGREAVIRTELFVVTGLALEVLHSRGYQVSDVVLDDDIEAEMKSVGRHAPSPNLSHTRNELTDATSRWIVLRSEGLIVGTIGFRYIDLGSMSLHEYLDRYFGAQHGPLTSTRVRQDAPRWLRDLSGPIIYAGDLWFHSDHRGDAAKSVAFTTFAHCFAFAQWPHAKHLFALHWRRHALAGKVEQYGFHSGAIRGVQLWEAPPKGREDSEQLSLVSREDWSSDLGYLANHPLEVTDPPIPQRSRA